MKKWYRLALLCLALLFGVCNETKAQFDFRYRNFTIEDGLPNMHAVAIVQDPTGFLWMGTYDGLVRYDGYTFKVFKHEETGNRRLLLRNRIRNLYLNPVNGLLFIQLRNYQYSCYDTKNRCFIDFTGGMSDMKALYSEIAFLPDGTTWLLSKRDKSIEIKFENGKITSRLYELGSEMVHEIYKNYVDERYHPEKTLIDRQGYKWTMTQTDGLYIEDTQTGEKVHYTAGMPGSPITTNTLFSIYEDRGGNIWVCQADMGLVCITIASRDITHQLMTKVPEPGYKSYARMLRKAQDGIIYVGNRESQLFTVDSVTLKLNEIPNPVPDDDILCLCFDKEGNKWMGTRRHGILINGKSHTGFPGNENAFTRERINDIFRDSKDRIWVGAVNSGIYLAKPAANGEYDFERKIYRPEIRNEVNVIRQLKDGTMCVGFGRGLAVFNPDELIADTLKYYFYSAENSSLASEEIRDILEDRDGNIWIASVGAGVFKATGSKDKLQFKQYTTKNGLPNDLTCSLQLDKNGNLWIGTEYGISLYNKKSEQFTNIFPCTDHLGNLISEKASTLLADGRLVFGTMNGVIAFHPDSVRKNVSKTFNLTFTNLSVNGTPYDKTDSIIDYSQTIKLNHNQNTLTFNFSDFEYIYPKRTKYYYKLSGFDQDWTMTVGNEAVYRELSPGKYTFQVRTLNANGSVSEEISMQVQIRQPWWNTWWAWCIYLLAIGCIGWLIYRQLMTVYKLKSRVRVERKLADFKSRFFMNISHEFRTPLTLIRGSVEKLSNRNNLATDVRQTVNNMNHSVERMLRLVNQLLEYNKMQEGKLHLGVQQTDVIQFVNRLCPVFFDMAERRNMKFEVDTFADTHTMMLDRSAADKIIYNLLSNAFKYTPDGGKISLKVEQDRAKKVVKFIVADTGVGISKEKQKDLFSRFMDSAFAADSIGIGLNLTKELVALHHGSIDYEENPRGGSIFTVSLPDENIYADNEMAHEITPNSSLNANALATPDQESNQSMLTGESANIEIDADAVAPLNDKHILIIEDDTDVCQFLKEEMEQYFQVQLRHDGASGLEEAQQNDYDLIICDVMMPKMNGYEVVSRLKSKFDTCHIPIILLTALGAEENQLKGITTGADAYITKPFSPRLLLARVIQLIDQRNRIRERFASETTTKETPSAASICTNPLDKKFMEKFNQLLSQRLTDPDLSLDELARELAVGRTVFFRKVKGVTGFTPNEYIRVMRLKKAAEMLAEGEYTVNDTAYSVGYNDPLYFSRCFKQQFGVSPSAYLKGERRQD